MAPKPRAPELTAIEQRMVDILSAGRCHIKELSAELDRSANGIVELAQKLKDKGVHIVKHESEFALSNEVFTLPAEDVVIKDNKIKIAFVANTMLGSVSEQPTNLCKAFQIAEEDGVDVMIHLGVTAGRPTNIKKDEFHKLTADEQIEYIVKNYPRSKKFKTRMISGFHDMQWRKGKDSRNIVAEICRGREDLDYRGDWQSDFQLRRGPEKGARWPNLRAAFHGGDDAPYSKSHAPQGFGENQIQDVRDIYSEDRSDIIVVAGQDIACDLAGQTIPELFVLPGLRLVPSSMMRKKRRSVVPTIGLVILTVKFEKDGTFTVEKAVYPLPAIKYDYREKPSDHKASVSDLTVAEKTILKLLEKSPKTLGELTQALDRSDASVKTLIAKLQKAGFSISEPDDPENPSKNYRLKMHSRLRFHAPKIDFKEHFHTTITRGGVSDTHIGHNSELLEIEHEAYDVFQAHGIKIVNHVGDITNGSPKHEEHNKGEVREFRATPLTNDVIALYPYRKGIETHMISGDHDRWFLDSVGYDLLDPITRVRSDIKYLGIQQGESIDGRFITWLKHFNWGTGYARSYKPQQVAEGLLKEIEKESARYRGKIFSVLSGGGHVYCAMLYKGIVFILMPCLQGKTGFITGLGKLSDVGFIIYSLTHNSEGVLTRFTIEYFDRGAKAQELIRQKVEDRKRDMEVKLAKLQK